MASAPSGEDIHTPGEGSELARSTESEESEHRYRVQREPPLAAVGRSARAAGLHAQPPQGADQGGTPPMRAPRQSRDRPAPADCRFQPEAGWLRQWKSTFSIGGGSFDAARCAGGSAGAPLSAARAQASGRVRIAWSARTGERRDGVESAAILISHIAAAMAAW